jgi:hypothetical protein
LIFMKKRSKKIQLQIDEDEKVTVESETPFTDWAKEKDPEKKARLLSRFQSQSETKHKLDKLIPETEPPEFKTKTIEQLKVEAVEKSENGETRLTQYNIQKPQKTCYIIKKNPSIVALTQLNKNKIYYDSEKDEFFEYVISNDRKKLLQKNRLDSHDILNMLAFCLFTIYEEMVPKRLYINKKLKEKTIEIARKVSTHLGQNSHGFG